MNLEQNNKATIQSIAYVEMYVGNIFYAKTFYLNALKFTHIATCKDEECIRFLLKQGDIHIVLTSSLNSDNAISKHVNYYGDSVKKISLWVDDVNAHYASAVLHGAQSVLFPEQKHGVLTAEVELFNNVLHEYLQIGDDLRIPGFSYDASLFEKTPMLFEIDHIAWCYPANTIDKWVKFYQNAFGFTQNKNEDIYSEESGMHIIIMISPNGKVKFPLSEPSSPKSPLHFYLKHNNGGGVQHIAFATPNIINAVKHYENNFGELRKATTKYYDEVKATYPNLVEKISKLEPYGIMLEQDDKGVLFQIFTRSVGTRSTLFLEFIERDICEGFGSVNIKTLYESLEA